MSHVVVIGAGITGLQSARRLTALGDRVTVVEAGDRVGGQIRTVPFAGRPVDVGAEAAHLGAPHLAQLARDLGLYDDAQSSRPGSSWLHTEEHGLRPLPEGVGPTGPSRLLPVLRTRGLTVPGMLRAATEPWRADPLPERDVSVGEAVEQRFGPEVVDRFVDPLLGTLHAGDVHRLSLRSTAVQLAAVLDTGESLLVRSAKARRRPSPLPPGPMFASWADGLSRLPQRMADTLDAEILLSTTASGISPDGSAWQVHIEDGGGSRSVGADAVVVTAPVTGSAPLLDGLVPEAARLLRLGRVADVATVLLALRREDVDHCPNLHGHNGVLLGSTTQGMLKAATFLSSKWEHLDGDPFLVRCSVGRVGTDRLARSSDDEVVAAVRSGLRRTVGLEAEPQDALVTRWPGAMPQLEVGHGARLRRVRSLLPPTLALAGAPYDGLGLSATVTSASVQADALHASLGGVVDDEDRHPAAR